MNIYHLGWSSRNNIELKTPLNHGDVGQWGEDKELRVNCVLLKAQDEVQAKNRVLEYFPDAKFHYVVFPTEQQITIYEQNHGTIQ